MKWIHQNLHHLDPHTKHVYKAVPIHSGIVSSVSKFSRTIDAVAANAGRSMIFVLKFGPDTSLQAN